MSEASLEGIKKIVQSIQKTKDQEIGCADCFAILDQFMDLLLQGRPAAELMPLVQEHLERCGDCREEFTALMAALQAAA